MGWAQALGPRLAVVGDWLICGQYMVNVWLMYTSIYKYIYIYRYIFVCIYIINVYTYTYTYQKNVYPYLGLGLGWALGWLQWAMGEFAVNMKLICG